ncbi:MAG: hypothetical protein WCL19_08995 [Verrucomicrobiota bacterium]
MAVSLGAVSCERHEFEGPNGTKQLHGHGPASAEHGEAAGHGEKAEHGEATGHGEKAEH